MLKSFSIPYKYRLMIPMAAILLIILIFPLGYSFNISLQNLELNKLGNETYVGLRNYVAIFSNKSFWTAMRNTITFVVIAVGLEFLIGFSLALLLHNKSTWLRSFFRSFLLTPMFITPIAVGLMFRFLLNSQLGVIPQILKTIGVNVDWFGPRNALFSICLIDVWQWTPFMLLLLLAGLESLPEEPFEAARVDGAQGWMMIRHITFPMMRPIILSAIVIRMLDAFKVYEYIYAITRGGPGETTESIQYYIYRIGFIYFRSSEAAAMSYVLILAIIILVSILFVILKKGTNE